MKSALWNRLAVAASVSLVLSAAPASAEMLSGDAIRSLIQDRTVHLATPYGVTLPLRYASNGEVTGDISGITLARMFTPSETGSWWVDGNQMCQQWPSWYDGKRHCFTIKQTGENSIEWVRDDGLSGTARISG
ncbi:MAG: hypothetical protein ACK4F5_01130 [Aliihoeflea sp.]